jgi:hypothetical protein
VKLVTYDEVPPTGRALRLASGRFAEAWSKTQFRSIGGNAMESLLPLVRGYLDSAGFKILVQQPECLVADKLVFGQERDTWIVWTVPPDQEVSRYEATLRAGISALHPNYPDARAFVLASSRRGLSREFQQELSDQRIRLLVPVQFFDAAFKVEEAPRAASAIADIRSLEILEKRVAQPYTAQAPSGESVSGPDLLDTLFDELAKIERPTVRIVVGRAGIGKSFLSRALFARMYDDFLQAKAGLVAKPRPVPLLPEHIKGIYAIRTELLIENFLRTDVASPVGRETFEWLLVNGFTTWLLDGLDELYAGDPSFFEYLADLVTRKDSKAQIAIWCRDSLVTTSDTFTEFQDLCAGSTMLKIYRLSEWERSSKRQFAWLGLEGRRLSKLQDPDTNRVATFLREIEGSPTLRSLSGLPFYCELLLQQFSEGQLQTFGDDVAMLNHVVDRMIQREVDKGLLDLRLLLPNGLQDWLEQIAINYAEGRRYADIDRDEAMEYGRLVLRDGVDERTERHILLSLLQFPLFRAGTETGRIAFAHELIADALAARIYLRGLRERVGNIGVRLSRVDLEDPTILRFMAGGVSHAEEASVLEELQRASPQDRAFAVLLTLLMLARPERDLLKRARVGLEGRNLVGVRFQKRDLAGASFRHADLSHTEFRDCDLQGALFEGAFLHRTRFEGENRLQKAQFGDLTRVQSVFAGRRLLEDVARIREWVDASTGQPTLVTEPCPTALQVRHLFGKFVTPLGTAKRDDLKRDGLAAGKRYGGAAPTEACIEEAVAMGYMAGPDFRGRFRRAEGDKYAEMVKLVRDGSVSDGLGRLFARLCPRRACLHQLHG